MIIYSEILGQPFDSVKDCLEAEEEYRLKEELKKRQEALEQEALEKQIKDTYEVLVNTWANFTSLIEKTGTDLDMDSKALLFVEVVLDADEKRKTNHLKS